MRDVRGPACAFAALLVVVALHVFAEITTGPSLLDDVRTDARVAVVTVAIGQPWPIRQNHFAWAERHGYAYHEFTDEAALLGEAYADKRVFAKLLAVAKVLRRGNTDFVLVIDADAIIVEPSFSLDALVATMARHSYSVLFSGDWQYNLNAGIMLFRNNAYALKLLDDVVARGARPRHDGEGGFVKGEQTALIKYMCAEPDVRQCTKRTNAILPTATRFAPETARIAQRPWDAYMFSYQYGDAIIHFAGLSFLGSYRVALLNLLLRHPYLRPPFKVLCHMVSLVAIPVLQTPLPRALLERAYS